MLVKHAPTPLQLLQFFRAGRIAIDAEDFYLSLLFHDQPQNGAEQHRLRQTGRRGVILDAARKSIAALGADG